MKLVYLLGAFVLLSALLAVPAFVSAQASPLTITLNPSNASGQSGTAVLTDLGNGKTRVDVTITGEPSGADEPMHIHQGTCPNPGAVVYPLTNVVNGKSTTDITATLASLTGGTFAINGHKSATQLDQPNYVFCGNITASAQVTGTARATTQATAAVTTTATTAATAVATTAATAAVTATRAATVTTTAPTAVATTTTAAPGTLPTTGGDASGVGVLVLALGLMLAAAGLLVRRFTRPTA